jgi:SAM-dependent methyltransferase
MHQAALDFIAGHASDAELVAVDIGGRETNGHARWLWPNASWTVVDAADGPGVDIVADGAEWQPESPVDLVLCAEVAEHTPAWREILANIITMLRLGGQLVFTAAGPGRPVHGLHHDDPLCPGWYENIAPDELLEALHDAGFTRIEVNVLADDVRAVAWR